MVRYSSLLEPGSIPCTENRMTSIRNYKAPSRWITIKLAASEKPILYLVVFVGTAAQVLTSNNHLPATMSWVSICETSSVENPFANCNTHLRYGVFLSADARGLCSGSGGSSGDACSGSHGGGATEC